MPLNASGCAADIWNGSHNLLSLDADGVPVEETVEFDLDSFKSVFVTSYNNYAKGGIVLGAVNTGGDTSVLESIFDGEETTASKMGAAFATFWSTVAITNGAPAHGGTAVASVVNNASALSSAFIAAVDATITDKDSPPYYEDLISNMEGVVKTIQWIVTEIMPTVPPSPSPFPETIS